MSPWSRSSRGSAWVMVWAANDWLGRVLRPVWASTTSAAVCLRRSSVCCRRCSALLSCAVSLAIRGGGMGEGTGGDAGMDFREQFLEAAADGPVEQMFVGVAASFFDGRGRSEHDGLEET